MGAAFVPQSSATASTLPVGFVYVACAGVCMACSAAVVIGLRDRRTLQSVEWVNNAAFEKSQSELD